MLEAISQRRYLIPFKAARLPQQFTDVLVIGGGVAGLRAAIAAADQGADVLVLTKDTVDQSNTWYAQGGIAAVLQPADSYQSHVDDTEKGGAGLCDHAAVDVVIKEGPQRVLELLEWGANFDKQAGNALGLAFTREGGHSFARILHAYGDATGMELAQTLIRTVRGRESIRISENSFAIDLVTEDGRCLGVLALVHGQVHLIWAKRTILASGGAGQLYRETTNPRIATADGHAMAYRAGATLQDMEMVQFHPTTLYVAGASRALITEAVRGEGAYLLDRNEHRFMPDYHEMAELAPRDVVSRAIVEQIRKTHFTHVFLDVRHLPVKEFRERFPQLLKYRPFRDRYQPRPDPRSSSSCVHDRRRRCRPGRPCQPQRLVCRGRGRLLGSFTAQSDWSSNSLLEGLTFGALGGTDAGRDANRGGPKSVNFPLSAGAFSLRRDPPARSWTSPVRQEQPAERSL